MHVIHRNHELLILIRKLEYKILFFMYYILAQNKQKELILLMRGDTILFPKDGNQTIDILSLKKE